MRAAIQTDQAPKAIGTYSQAVKVGNTVYLSGQIPLDPITMVMVEGGFQKEAEQVFANLKAVVVASGGQLADVVKLTIYLIDLVHFQTVNEVMASYFTEPFPARAAIAVKALPKDAQIEIDAIMVLED